MGKSTIAVLFLVYIFLCSILVAPLFIYANSSDGHEGLYLDEITTPGSLMGSDGFTVKERKKFIKRAVELTVTVHTDCYTEEEGLEESVGTGSIIHGGYILTAKHVIEDAAFVSVSFHELSGNGYRIEKGRRVPARVIAVSKKYDAALLQLVHQKESKSDVLMMDLKWRPKTHEVAWYIGQTTRWGRGLIISKPKTADGKDATNIILNVQAFFGDSGGPLLTTEGKLVGVLKSIGNDSMVTSFVPIYVLKKEFMDKLK